MVSAYSRIRARGWGRPACLAGGGHDPLRQLQHFPGALGQGLGAGLLAQGLQGPGPDPGDVLFGFVPRRQLRVGGSRACRKAFSTIGVPELQAQAEIVEDHVALLAQPLTQEMAKRQVIAIHPGVVEDLPVEDEEGRFALVEVLLQFLGPFRELLPGAHG